MCKYCWYPSVCFFVFSVTQGIAVRLFQSHLLLILTCMYISSHQADVSISIWCSPQLHCLPPLHTLRVLNVEREEYLNLAWGSSNKQPCSVLLLISVANLGVFFTGAHDHQFVEPCACPCLDVLHGMILCICQVCRSCHIFLFCCCTHRNRSMLLLRGFTLVLYLMGFPTWINRSKEENHVGHKR